MDKLYTVFIENEGFISTFNKLTNEYTTSLNLMDTDYNVELRDVESIAKFFNGKVFEVTFED